MTKVYEYYTMMNEDNIMLAFKGGVTSDLLTSLLQVAESKLESMEEPPKVKKKIFNILVECFQNVYHHLDKTASIEDVAQSAILMVGKEKDDYVIMTGNHMDLDKVHILKSKIDMVNGMDKDQLKSLYREVLNNEEISDKGGAGLGIIDIARRSGEKLDYEFKDIDSNQSYFSLKVKVSA